MAATEVVMSTGERYEVAGAPGEIEGLIIEAARGSIMKLAWLTETGTARPIGVNPQHVAALRPAVDSATEPAAP